MKPPGLKGLSPLVMEISNTTGGAISVRQLFLFGNVKGLAGRQCKQWAEKLLFDWYNYIYTNSSFSGNVGEVGVVV